MNHQELNRSGVSTFFTEQAARENELRAFQGAMENNYAQGIMTGFNRLGTVYSGASKLHGCRLHVTSGALKAGS
ncbi:MAG: hypothetical protein ACLTER_27215 [Ruminococcus sp.]